MPRLGVLIALAVLAGCGSGLRVTPDAWCPAGIEGEGWRDTLARALEDCAPMIRLTLPSHVEKEGGP